MYKLDHLILHKSGHLLDCIDAGQRRFSEFVIFSFLQCLSGGQVSNRQGRCEGNSNKVLSNTFRFTFVSCKVLHVGEDHLHKIVAFG